MASLPGTPQPASWEEILSGFEEELDATERLLDRPGTEIETGSQWVAPSHLGPLPRHLVQRAKELLARQATVRQRLGTASTAAHRQQAFASKVAEATTTRPAPVYLDLEA